MNIVHVFLLIAAVLLLAAGLIDDLTKWVTTPLVLAILAFIPLMIAIIYAFTP